MHSVNYKCKNLERAMNYKIVIHLLFDKKIVIMQNLKTSKKPVWTPSQSAERKLPMAKIRQEKNDGGKWWQVLTGQSVLE